MKKWVVKRLFSPNCNTRPCQISLELSKAGQTKPRTSLQSDEEENLSSPRPARPPQPASPNAESQRRRPGIWALAVYFYHSMDRALLAQMSNTSIHIYLT